MRLRSALASLLLLLVVAVSCATTACAAACGSGDCSAARMGGGQSGSVAMRGCDHGMSQAMGGGTATPSLERDAHATDAQQMRASMGVALEARCAGMMTCVKVRLPEADQPHAVADGAAVVPGAQVALVSKTELARDEVQAKGLRFPPLPGGHHGVLRI